MIDDEVRVVVVDDDRDTTDALAYSLECDGYTVKTAYNGVEALTLIDDFQPLCVLTDISMPGMDGLELSARLRTQYGRDMILVAVTGWAQGDKTLAPGYETFDYCFRKPVDLGLFKKVLPPLR